MKQINYAVIGCGMMGREHIANIQLFADARVAAIADPNADSLQSTRALLPEDVAAFTSTEQLLKQADFDALVIAAPNNLHKATLELIFSSCNNQAILVEKPLCTTDDDCQALISAAQNYSAPVWVAMEYRYMAPIEQLIKNVHAGMIGDLRMLSIREHRFPFLEKVGDWNRFNSQSGGTLVEKCCHFFDLMRLIFQDEPTRLYASGGADVNHSKERYDGKQPDILDNALVVLDFPGSRRALLELCMFAEGSEYQETLGAIGSRAKIEAFVPGPQRFWPGALEDPASAPQAYSVFYPRLPKNPMRQYYSVPEHILHAGDHQGATYHQHAKFRECILSGKAPEVTMADGAKAVTIGLAAERSVATGLPIDLNP